MINYLILQQRNYFSGWKKQSIRCLGIFSVLNIVVVFLPFMIFVNEQSRIFQNMFQLNLTYIAIQHMCYLPCITLIIWPWLRNILLFSYPIGLYLAITPEIEQLKLITLNGTQFQGGVTIGYWMLLITSVLPVVLLVEILHRPVVKEKR